MRMTFDRSVPVHIQISRIVKSHTGRKHQHRKGPGRVSAERRAANKQRQLLARAKQKRFSKLARAYWSGESDVHP